MDNILIVDYSNWTPGKEYPEWMDEISLATISKGYLLPGETVRQAWLTYRQNLRDITSTQVPSIDSDHNLINITWPTPPS